MADDPKKIASDDEYQFPQDEYAASSHADQSKASDDSAASAAPTNPLSAILNRLSQMKHKRILIAAVIVIFLIIFVRLLEPGKKTSPTPSVAEQAPSVVVEKTDDSAMIGSLDALKAHTSQTQTQLNDLRSQVTSLQNAVNTSQAQNQQLQTTVTKLEDQIKEISEQLNALMIRPVSGKRIVYHLRAILPDRAWIISDQGNALTVTVGDRVEQYGTIKAIDAQHGILETSSGRKIQYGVNDR